MQSPLFRSVEARVASLTGISPHPHASGADLLLQARWPHDYDTNNPLHHDMNRAPRRVATVIMYLTDLGGGHTLFPCLRPRGMDGGGAKSERDATTTGSSMASASCAELVHGFEELRKRELPARKDRITQGANGSVSGAGSSNTSEKPEAAHLPPALPASRARRSHA